MTAQNADDVGDAQVIAVASDDRWAHVYATEKHALIGAGSRRRSAAAADFFDATGRALTAVRGPGGELLSLEPGAAAPDPDAVRDRLHAVLGLVPAVMRQPSDRIAGYLAEQGTSLDETVANLPSLSGADLAETLRRYRTILGPHPMDDDLQDRGSFWHNFVVHGF